MFSLESGFDQFLCLHKVRSYSLYTGMLHKGLHCRLRDTKEWPSVIHCKT